MENQVGSISFVTKIVLCGKRGVVLAQIWGQLIGQP